MRIQNMLMIITKMLRNTVHDLGIMSLFVLYFSKRIGNVMYVSRNIHLIGFQNCFGLLSRFARGRMKFQMYQLVTNRPTF